MAYIYMRPTADIYVNHTMYPEGSANGYILINEEVSDGSATYIGVTTGNADIRVTKSSSFVLAGIDIPDECQITNLRLIVRCSAPSSGTIKFLSSYTVTSNGVVCVSDVYEPEKKEGLMICAIIVLFLAIRKKAITFFSKSQEEQLEIAKSQIKEVMLRLVTEAEQDYYTWIAAGAVKRSQVIDQVFEMYPILSKVTNQEEIIAFIDGAIDEALKTMRKIFDENFEAESKC